MIEVDLSLTGRVAPPGRAPPLSIGAGAEVHAAMARDDGLSSESAELLRWRGRLEIATRIARKTGQWEPLKGFGVEKPKEAHELGRKARTDQQRDRIVDVYVNMRTAPGPCFQSYARVPDHKGEFLVLAADMSDAQRDGQPVPEIPAELVFVPEHQVPMSHADAVRELAKFMVVKTKTAREFLRDELEHRKLNAPDDPTTKALARLLE